MGCKVCVKYINGKIRSTGRFSDLLIFSIFGTYFSRLPEMFRLKTSFSYKK